MNPLPNILGLEEKRRKHRERRRKLLSNPEYRAEHRRKNSERKRKYFLNPINKERRRKRIKALYTNPKYRERKHQQHNKQRRNMREEAISLRGGRCVKCTDLEWKRLERKCAEHEVDTQRILQFDHIRGGGGKENRENGLKQKKLWRDVKENPNKYQILCPNHNQEKKYTNGEGYNNSSEVSSRAKRRRNKRKETLSFLGGKCVECKDSNWMHLNIDHIGGNGRKEKRSIGHEQRFYRRVLEHPKKYQILCANDNWIKRVKNKEV